MPTTSVRLRIPNYNTIDKGPAGTQGKDLIFALQVSRIQKDITDGATVLPYVGFGSSMWSFSFIKMVITLTGTILEDASDVHSAHPVTTATEHVPDFIDMEEAAVGWNNSAVVDASDLTVLPELQIEHDGSSYRIYKGVISKLVMVRTEGKSAVDFVLTFGVAWSEINPTLREWST